MFSHVLRSVCGPYPNVLDPYAFDHRPDKVDLNAGIYLDGRGNVPVLKSVRTAIGRVADANASASCLPIEGDQTFRTQVGGLLFGSQFESLRDSLAIVQTVGGAGALRTGADFLRCHFPASYAYASAPTWENHTGIFEGAGFAMRQYRYFDTRGVGLDLPGMISDLCQLKPHDVVVLHSCCHNPTGVDPRKEQWTQILDLLEERNLIPFIDSAYQGLAAGLDADAFVVRELARRRRSFLVAMSFSKIFSLYGERCGALIVHCADSGQTANVLDQLKLTVRRYYSSPPAQGMKLVSTVLSDHALRSQWVGELDAMRTRLIGLRRDLHAALIKALPGRSFNHIVRQRGLFAFTGLNAQEVSALQSDFGVYADVSGRLCIAGLNESNLEYVAKAIGKVAR